MKGKMNVLYLLTARPSKREEANMSIEFMPIMFQNRAVVLGEEHINVFYAVLNTIEYMCSFGHYCIMRKGTKDGNRYM